MLLDIKNRAKPIIKWAGGKSSLLTQLQEHFPKNCKRYFEPFLGGGAVFLSLKEGIPSVLNDSNEELFNLYSVLKNEPSELMKALDELSKHYSEEFYYQIRACSFEDKVEQAARTIFLNKAGFNGLYRQNSKGGFNVPFGKREKCPQLYEEANLLRVSQKFQKAQLLCLDFEAIIDMAEEGDFVYCDPPYHPLSRTSSFNSYQAGGFSEIEQQRLAEACFRAGKRGVLVAVSNSAAELIYKLYENASINIVSAKRAINSNGSKRGQIQELLILIHDNEDKSTTALIQSSNKELLVV